MFRNCHVGFDLVRKHVLDVSQTLAFVCWMSRYGALSLKPNGPAV